MNEKIFDFLFSKNKKKSFVFSKDETDGVEEEEDKNYLCWAVRSGYASNWIRK
jgi:hypothetical protein